MLTRVQPGSRQVPQRNTSQLRRKWLFHKENSDVFHVPQILLSLCKTIPESEKNVPLLPQFLLERNIGAWVSVIFSSLQIHLSHSFSTRNFFSEPPLTPDTVSIPVIHKTNTSLTQPVGRAGNLVLRAENPLPRSLGSRQSLSS